MTLEEAILAANNGDVERMNFLGQYYFGQKYLADSIAWFSRAAQAGDLDAAKKVDLLSKTLAAVCEEMGDWSGAFEFWTQYRDCQQLFIQTPQSVDNANFQYIKNMNHAIYRQGVACFHMQLFDSALNFLRTAAMDFGCVRGDEDAKKFLSELLS